MSSLVYYTRLICTLNVDWSSQYRPNVTNQLQYEPDTRDHSAGLGVGGRQYTKFCTLLGIVVIRLWTWNTRRFGRTSAPLYLINFKDMIMAHHDVIAVMSVTHNEILVSERVVCSACLDVP